MDMDQAAVFLAGSVLTMMGMVVIIAGIILINNMIHRWWKPLGWFKSWGLFPAHEPVRFAEPHELDKSVDPKLK